jgi:hypothetical protein
MEQTAERICEHEIVNGEWRIVNEVHQDAASKRVSDILNQKSTIVNVSIIN